jgi:hypothetical protein
VINVTSPVAGETINILTTYPNKINWTITGTSVPTVYIYCYPNETSNYYQVSPDVVNASLGTYTWDITNKSTSTGETAQIRVTDSEQPLVFGESSAFNLFGKINVINPNSTEPVTVLTNTTVIRWNTTSIRELLNIQLSRELTDRALLPGILLENSPMSPPIPDMSR